MMQKSRFALAATILLSAQSQTTLAFAPSTSAPHARYTNTALNALQSDESNDAAPRRNPFKLFKPLSLAALTAASSVLMPQKAMASAPVTPIKNFKPPDSKAIALKKINDARNQEKMKEQMAYQTKCEEIEEAEGKAARQAYEKAYETAKVQAAEERSLNRKKLIYGLADMGICPFVDIEGERQVYLFDHGIDLNKVPATTQQKEMMDLRRDKKLVARREKERFLVKCIVEDQKLQGNDPVKYLEANQDKTKEFMIMKNRQFDAIVARYQELLQTQGSLSGVKADVPFDMAAATATISTSNTDTSAAEKAAKKAQEKAEKEKIKAEKAAAKEAAKAEKLAAKEAAKAAKETEKAAKLAEKTAAAEEVKKEATEEVEEIVAEEESTDVAVVKEEKSSSGFDVSKLMESPAVPIVGVVGVGGASFAFMQKSKAAKEADEEERQRQFNLLMGMEDSAPSIQEAEDDGTDDEPLMMDGGEKEVVQEKSTLPPQPVKKKKKRRGFFSSKKSDRETDLDNLVAEGAQAPEFAALLAKLLTFGAPGRFPGVTALEGGMPMETFDLEKANQLLVESREENELTDEISAEQFAQVVNCMIIDIIDLASSSLGGKDQKDQATVDALNIVMDFMDHAASLFDSVADGVVINPVTYGGDLTKSKLEQMYAIYATAGMTTMDGSVTQDRIDTLQQVFNINDKRAEGLVQKSMMKNLMNMMKDGGEGGMEEMLKVSSYCILLKFLPLKIFSDFSTFS